MTGTLMANTGHHNHLNRNSEDHEAVPFTRGCWLVRIWLFPYHLRLPTDLGSYLYILQPQIWIFVLHYDLRDRQLGLWRGT